MNAVNTLKLLFLAAVLSLTACGGDRLISDDAYRKQVREDFEARRALLGRVDDLKIVDSPELNEREREALQFLYAYMPVADAVNYPADFFLSAVRSSEEARASMPWGKKVPEVLYRHFVLPVRINNENLDDARRVFFAELRDRVGAMSMADAVLEVNHWCHEKVVYTPSDGRTSAPLALVRNAAGRCGEESTFLVTALRSVGIPARQVYTPRWAHTDDNHAWVEAWVDGQWHFLGACEPEPVLDLGWFNAPASRGMLMHTNVFGRYEGPEQVMQRTDLTTEINVTENYAPTSPVTVTVVDTEGAPVAGADIEYKVYNYAEFYTVARQKSDSEGRNITAAGRGDALVWVSKEGKYGFAKVSFGKDEAVTVVLDKEQGSNYRTQFRIVPPPEGCVLPPVTDAQRAENTRRMAVEDSIRGLHVATFATAEQGRSFAAEHHLDADRTAEALVAARGNRAQIEAFLAAAAAEGQGDRALDLLSYISKKDVRDTPAEVLNDHLHHAVSGARNVMSPRLGMELLTAWRSGLQREIPAADAARFRENPQTLVEWCREHITIADRANMRNVPVRPEGVWRSRVADRMSRDLFFVAAARALEIEAWLDPVSGKVRYMHDGKEYDVDFEAAEPAINDYGTLVLTYKPTAVMPDPRYYSHFTLSRIVDGRLQLFNYDEEAGWSETFRSGARLEAGEYLLVSGTRLDDGSVLTEVCAFSVGKDRTSKVELVIPEAAPSAEVVGQFDVELPVDAYPAAEGGRVALNTLLKPGYNVVGVIGANQEPSNHAFQDLAAFRTQLEQLGTPIVLLFESAENAALFKIGDHARQPSTLRLGIDSTKRIRTALSENLGYNGPAALPIIVITDEFGRVVYHTSGYTIGLGERLYKKLASLK